MALDLEFSGITPVEPFEVVVELLVAALADPGILLHPLLTKLCVA